MAQALVSFQKYMPLCTYQSTDAIRKRQLYIHIRRLMQSENGILLLFYIFLSHRNEKKQIEKRGVGCKKGGCCVLSTSTCDAYQILHLQCNSRIPCSVARHIQVPFTRYVYQMGGWWGDGGEGLLRYFNQVVYCREINSLLLM